MPLIISHPKTNPKIRKIEDDISVHHRSYFGLGDNYCIMWDFATILSKGASNWEPEINY